MGIYRGTWISLSDDTQGGSLAETEAQGEAGDHVDELNKERKS